MSLLHVEDLRLSFGGVRAVDGLSFGVEPGEIMSLIGPNGAGKTSAFNCITGFYRPTSGTVLFGGNPIDRLRPSAIAALGLSRTFQNLRLFGDLSVLDNVRAGMHLRVKQSVFHALLHTPRYHRGERELTEKAHDWLDFVGLRSPRGGAVRNLPYGEQRRVEIARALALEPQLLLLDEPGAGLNHTEKSELLDLVRRIRDLGIGVLLIEHDMGLVMDVSERVVVLNFGRKIAEGPPALVRRNPAVIEAYLGGEADDAEIEQARASVAGTSAPTEKEAPRA